MAAVRPRRSLAARVLWVTVALIVLSEALIFALSLAQERRDWLKLRVQEADWIVFLLRENPSLAADPAARAILLAMSKAMAISLLDAQGAELLRIDDTDFHSASVQAPDHSPLRHSAQASPESVAGGSEIALSRETLPVSIVRALITLFDPTDKPLELVTQSAHLPDAKLKLFISEQSLRAEMRRFAFRVAQLSLLLVAGAGGLMYLALYRLLVRPMRRLTEAIVAFRADPEHYFPSDPRISFPGGNEIAVAAEELAGMQRDLRMALWRKARVAAIGAAFSRACHDLRGALSVAMLAAERLNADGTSHPGRTTEALIGAVEQANALVSRTLDFMRQDAPEITRERFAVHDLVKQVATEITLLAPLCRVFNTVPKDLFVLADKLQLSRVLGNLMRNAAEAGAKRIVISARKLANATEIKVYDNGPGVPDAVRTALFQPFVSSRHGGTGLGLAIARELMHAHGGELSLESTGPKGTCFVIILPD